MSRLSAIILAAGLSSRMVRFKPLLPLGGRSLLARCVGLFREAGVDDVAVVVGHRAGETEAEADRLGVRVVHNPDYGQGMFSSVLAGVRALPLDAEAFFVLPVDVALVRPHTVRALRREFEERDGMVVYPRFLGERGHPPLIRMALAPEILAHDGTGGLHALLERHDDRARNVDVPDEGVVLDMDHPEHYEDALERADLGYPAPGECEALWKLHSVTPGVRAHCAAVARAAVALAEACNRRRAPGKALHVALVEGAALVHDVAKGLPMHARKGAETLREYGFYRAAPLVAAHPDLTLDPESPITEREIVFLADKLVRGAEVVPLERRYAEKREKFSGDPEAREAVLGRLERARIVAARFADETGIGCEELLASLPDADGAGGGAG